MSIQDYVSSIFSTITLVSQVIFVFSLVIALVNKALREKIWQFASNHVLKILFLVSLTALIGSLSFSNIAGFYPCELCWFQRIFMYPQAIILFAAMLKKDKNIVKYLLPLSVLGGLIAFYHSLTQWGFGSSLLGCTSAGGACAKVYVLGYNYITIPFMAFSAFAYMITLSIIYLKSRKLVF